MHPYKHTQVGEEDEWVTLGEETYHIFAPGEAEDEEETQGNFR
jgi:hypothetical protein